MADGRYRRLPLRTKSPSSSVTALVLPLLVCVVALMMIHVEQSQRKVVGWELATDAGRVMQQYSVRRFRAPSRFLSLMRRPLLSQGKGLFNTEINTPPSQVNYSSQRIGRHCTSIVVSGFSFSLRFLPSTHSPHSSAAHRSSDSSTLAGPGEHSITFSRPLFHSSCPLPLSVHVNPP